MTCPTRAPLVLLLVVVFAAGIQVSLAQWNSWDAWGTCSVSCGTGSSTRERTCSTGSCSGSATETTSCVIMNYCIPSYYGNTDKACGVDYFGCATGVTACVNLTQRCDGSTDCEDASDENPYYTGCTVTVCNHALQVGLSAVLVFLPLALAALLQTM